MKGKAVSGLLLILLFVSMLPLVFYTQPVKASGTIYIRADGSIEPPTANITTLDNVTYYFTDNNYDSIRIERDNIVLDGAGYTLQGTESPSGIELRYCNNLTLKNVKVTNFYNGIYLSRSSNNTLTGNIVTNNKYGIWLTYSSDNNVLAGNDALNNVAGIELRNCSDNVFVGNTALNNSYGIYLSWSSNNTLYHNSLINNTHQVTSYKSMNTWDDGYPSGGNYWSDYEGRYPNATEIDNSDIWDTPYVIDEDNQDNYPIVPEFPAILILPLFIITTLLTVVYVKRRKRELNG